MHSDVVAAVGLAEEGFTWASEKIEARGRGGSEAATARGPEDDDDLAETEIHALEDVDATPCTHTKT